MAAALIVGLGAGCSLRKFASGDAANGDDHPRTDAQSDGDLADHHRTDAQSDVEGPCGSDGKHACVDLAPAGWSGPVALATGAATIGAPSCTATGYERQVLSLFGVLNEGTATCACTCDPPPGMACGPVPLQQAAMTANCARIGEALIPPPDPPEYTLAIGQCTTVTPPGRFKPMVPAFTTSGGCTAHPTADIKMAAWTRRMVGCETNDSSPAGCPSSAVCIPTLVAPLEALCVYRTGDQACPSGAFSARTVYYDSFNDTRSCTACSCDTPTGSCQGMVTFTSGTPFPGQCSGMILEGNVDLVACIDIAGTGDIVAEPQVTPQGMCSPIGGALQGSVATSGAVTVCCKP